jgi:hypothetical protein
MHWCTHLSPIPLGPDIQTLWGVCLGHTIIINMRFLYENQEMKKCVRSGYCSSA